MHVLKGGEEEVQPNLSLSFLHSLMKVTDKPDLIDHLNKY